MLNKLKGTKVSMGLKKSSPGAQASSKTFKGRGKYFSSPRICTF